jgi:hypothetical protein
MHELTFTHGVAEIHENSLTGIVSINATTLEHDDDFVRRIVKGNGTYVATFYVLPICNQLSPNSFFSLASLKASLVITTFMGASQE